MDLGLTQQQRQQITPIIQQEAPKLEALKKGTTIKPVDKLEQLKQIADDLDGKNTPLLNADQQKKFQEIREESQSEFTSVRPQSVRRPAEAARRRAGDTR